MRRALSIALLSLLTVPVAAGAEPALLVRAGELFTSGPAGRIPKGAVLILDGRIAAVGPANEISAPEGASILDAAVVTPGLIDTHSVAGLAGIYNVAADQDADERSGPVQPGLRAIDGFNPREPLLDWLLAHGITTIQSGPGEANPIGGLAGVFKTRARNLEEATLRFPSALVLTLGESPKSTYREDRKAPMTRMGTAALIRTAFLEAQEYARKRATSGGLTVPFFGKAAKGNERPPRDLEKEALVLALEGQIPSLFTARREDDLLTALRIGAEFGLDVQLADAVEAYLVVREIREAGVAVHVGPVMERLSRLETMNASLENAAILHRHGVPISFQSGFESYVPKTHVVLFEAAVAGANGLGFEAALEALTLEAAKRLGVADRVGSLEVGKDADLVLFDGDPFEYTSHVDGVIVNGRPVELSSE